MSRSHHGSTQRKKLEFRGAGKNCGNPAKVNKRRRPLKTPKQVARNQRLNQSDTGHVSDRQICESFSIAPPRRERRMDIW